MLPAGRVLAIIPARGGSKGIPRKNMALLAGQPLVAITVGHARASARVNRIVVSTDDDEIAMASERAGAEVVRRPAAISGDEASSESALTHVLDLLFERDGYEPDLVVFLQVTSPLRHSGDIDSAVETLEQEEADSLLSVCPQHGFMWRRGQDGNWNSFSYDYANRPRRQDAPEDVVENGSIYVFRPKVLRSTGQRLGGKIAVHRMSYVDSMQIDEPGDIRVISRLMPAADEATLTERLQAVRLLALDCDGVLTDNHVWVDECGKESVSFSRADSYGIARLREDGVNVVVISKETNPVVSARCRKLGIPCVQGSDDKLPRLIELAHEAGCEAGEVAYAGNDLNDLECLRWTGVPIAVGDAEPEVKRAAAIVTRRDGGRHAVREICELILNARRKDSNVHGSSNWKSAGR